MLPQLTLNSPVDQIFNAIQTLIKSGSLTRPDSGQEIQGQIILEDLKIKKFNGSDYDDVVDLNPLTGRSDIFVPTVLTNSSYLNSTTSLPTNTDQNKTVVSIGALREYLHNITPNSSITSYRKYNDAHYQTLSVYNGLVNLISGNNNGEAFIWSSGRNWFYAADDFVQKQSSITIGDVIYKYGSYNAANAGNIFEVHFKDPFPTACDSIVVTPFSSSSSSIATAALSTDTMCNPTDGFKVFINNSLNAGQGIVAFKFNWIAIGR